MNEQFSFGLINIKAQENLAKNKIESFRKLKKGWRFGEGIPFEERTISNAMAINDEAWRYLFWRTDAFAGTNGEIMVAICQDTHYLEFIVKSNAEIDFLYEEKDEEVYSQSGLSLPEAKVKIGEYYRQWNGFESSGKVTTTKTKSDSSLLHLGQEATLAFRLLVESASSRLKKPSVDISPSIIQQLPMTHRSSGSSQKIYSRQAA